MPIVWPVTLPTAPEAGGYRESPPDNALRSQTDIGPPKSRQLATGAVRRISASYILDYTETEALDVFFVATTESGTLTFEWPHPRTGVTMVAQIMSPPIYSPLGGLNWLVTVEFEIQPEGTP